MFEKILNETSKLKNIAIKIDGVQIIQDDIMFLEIIQSIDDFGLHGTIDVKDTFDFNNSGLFNFNGNNILDISLTDIADNKSFRTYRIVDTKIVHLKENHKVFTFHIVDEITFILQNTYMSKSFNCTPVEAFQQYIKELKIDTILKNNQLKQNVIDTSTKHSFVVPQNVSVYDFFVEKFKEDNIHLYQDRYGLHVQEIKLKTLKRSKDNDGVMIVYTNKTTNNFYLYKIHDFKETRNNTRKIMNCYPTSKIFRFDNNKYINDSTLNFVDVSKNLSLATSDTTALIVSTGEKYGSQSTSTNTNTNQNFDLFNIYMKTCVFQMAVPCELKASNIGIVANIVLKGNISSADSTQKGDQVSSGMYFINSVSDRIIGDKMIHRLTLIRTDSQIAK